MSEERAEEDHKRDEGIEAQSTSSESAGSKVDPDFIPEESHENPNEKRAREHPEETGS